MSIKAMTWVWEHSTMDGPRLLLLLALADYANDEGTHCYPSIKTLARRCRRSGRRTQALLRELEAVGEIDIELGAGTPSAHGATNRYVLRRYREAMGLIPPSAAGTADVMKPTGVRKPTGVMKPTGVTKSAGVTKSVGVMKSAGVTKPAPQGCQNQHPRGAEIVTPGSDETVTPGVLKLSPNPSVEPSVEPPLEPSVEPPGGAARGDPPRPAPVPAEVPTVKGSRVWDAYALAYQDRYGVEPVRNGKVNGQLAHLVKRLGAEAPAVAGFYVRHNHDWYVRRGHAVDCLLADAEKLRTEWATGQQITATQARNLDQQQTTVSLTERLIEKFRREGKLIEEPAHAS